MSKPIVAIIGRPNVGKSSLFNRLAGERISITDDKPGVTRDRIYTDVEWLDNKFTLIDTGGIEIETDNYIVEQMRMQAEVAIDTADVIIFLVDGKTGVVDADKQVASMLRKSKKPIVLAVNKIDNMTSQLLNIYEFYNLGLGDPIPISANQPLNLGDMLDEVIDHFKDIKETDEDDDVIKVAVIGKPNVGKSSLINKILGKERVIVSNIPGTTRDAIDTDITIEGQKYVFIDTAGLRRKSKVDAGIEWYSTIRTVSAVERADIIIIMIDANEGVTKQDTKVAGIAHEAGKGSILVVNKWDTIEKDNNTTNRYLNELAMDLAYMAYAPRLFISAKTGLRIHKLFETIKMVSEAQNTKINTGLINEVLYEAMAMNQPPSDKGKALKIFYSTQVSVKPPTFILFVNDRKLMHFSYLRYIENEMRSAFGFIGTPVHFIVRERSSKDNK